MSATAKHPLPRKATKAPYARITELLGNIGRPIDSPFELHERLEHGLPGSSAIVLMQSFRALKNDKAIEKALGMSERTLHRLKAADAKARRLDVDQSCRVWQLADVYTKAQEVLGSKEEAERWMTSPAIGLNSRRPIDLLATATGGDLVKTLLERMEYGIYA